MLYLGVALSTRAQLVLALLSITVVLIFSVYVILKVGSGNHVAKAFTPSSSPNGWTGVMFGVLYGVLLFTGFETAANLGEETAHPKRDIPRAVLISVLVVSGFYVLCCYAQIAGFHFSLDAIGKNAGAPLFGLAGPTSDGRLRLGRAAPTARTGRRPRHAGRAHRLLGRIVARLLRDGS